MIDAASDAEHGVNDKRHFIPDLLRNAVGATCHRLQNNYFCDPNSREHHSARAALAELRRHASLDITGDALALANALFVMDGEFANKLAGKGDDPTDSEYAAFVALTLFGIHMQSATSPQHIPGTSFAAACGKLHSLEISDSIKPRIDAMLLAGNEKSRLVHIRSLITLLRGQDIGLDYGLLAQDLRALSDPRKRSGVQLRWGRDFANGYFMGRTTNNSAKSTPESN